MTLRRRAVGLEKTAGEIAFAGFNTQTYKPRASFPRPTRTFRMNLPHLPLSAAAKPYESLDKVEVVNHRTGQPMATVSQVNAGIIRKDLAKIGEARARVEEVHRRRSSSRFPRRLASCSCKATLPLGDKGHTQSRIEYIETLSATSGLPHVMVQRNMQKIHHAMTHVGVVLNGLTRGLDALVIDRGYGEQSGAAVSYYPTTNALGLVMPSNSPAVNSLWLPAIALKTPVIIKPGREEPWTPYRLIQAFIAAGAPAEAFGFYPTDHEGSAEVLKLCGRALIFGDANTVAQYRDNPKFSVHGPGFSKILIGEDQVDHWREHIDLIAGSIAENGGRSCVNASAVVVPRHAAEIADALARKLGPIEPLSPTNPDAKLSGFANPKMAEYIDGAIEADLATPGATEVTAKYRKGPRKVEFEGGVYLRPTIVHCDSFKHPLANREFLCPTRVSSRCRRARCSHRSGRRWSSRRSRGMPHSRSNCSIPRSSSASTSAPISTMKISWDQPHEGNMFEFLYSRRSIERAGEIHENAETQRRRGEGSGETNFSAPLRLCVLIPTLVDRSALRLPAAHPPHLRRG
jgi:acyl-CoA reductase-like NAD-dependent aldehyde dehydrogenase